MKKMAKWVFLLLVTLGVTVAMPLSGYGADLTVGNTISGNGNMTLNGTITATSLSGNGSGLTNLNGANITGIVTTSIANSAVTSAKVAFYSGHVAIVANSGGDYTDPSTAMTNYATWCPGERSATNPCLLRIMPGVYNMSYMVVMQPFIDIEGSGEKVTKLSYPAWGGGAVYAADNSELRFLTVESAGSTSNIAIRASGGSPSLNHVTAIATAGTYNFGVLFEHPGTPKLTNVTIIASGGQEKNEGLSLYDCSPMMTNVTITASGGITNYGIDNYASSPVMTNVTVTSEGGSYNYGISSNSNSSGTTKINNSVIKGTTWTIYNLNSSIIRVGNTQLDGGGAVYNTGTLTCVGAFDSDYVALGTTCQ